MKTALILTTINVPKVLALYRQIGPEVQFFVAGDEKTPPETAEFCKTLGNCEYYSPARQRELGHACSPLIDWNCIQRRNIALLEALKWGADVIVTIDDDNLPMTPGYFGEFEQNLMAPFNGLRVDPGVWFNVGALADPFFIHRGFPIGQLPNCYSVKSAIDARVGVSAGVCLGDPDISAVDRISQAPISHRANEILKSGVVFKPQWKNWTVFNSQNTAFLRELAPAMFMLPGIGRYDDIYASLICQRVMRERKLHVHFGQPFVWQERNAHDLIKDLKAEIFGMENIVSFADELNGISFGKDVTVVGMVRAVYNALAQFLPSAYAGLAFCDDCEKIL